MRKRGDFVPVDVSREDEKNMIFFLQPENHFWSYYWNVDSGEVYKYYDGKWQIFVERKYGWYG